MEMNPDEEKARVKKVHDIERQLLRYMSATFQLSPELLAAFVSLLARVAVAVGMPLPMLQESVRLCFDAHAKDLVAIKGLEKLLEQLAKKSGESSASAPNN